MRRLGLQHAGPDSVRAFFFAILAGLCTQALPTAAHAAPVSVDRLGERYPLAAVPSFSVVAGDGRFVLGFAKNGGTDLSVMTFGDGRPAETARVHVSFPIADGAVGHSGRTLIAVGAAADATGIAFVDLASGTVMERALAVTFTNPLVAVDDTGTIHIADKGFGRIAVFDAAAQGHTSAPAVPIRSLYFDSAFGVGSLFVTAGGEYAFVGDRASPRLSVIDATGRVRDTLSIDSESKSSRPPVPATISFHDGSDGVPVAASLLLADYNTESLQMIDFEPVLLTMSVTATSSIAIPIRPNTFVKAAPIAGARLSPVLLGASPDEGTIVVGNRFSTRLLFFSRRGRLLERTGSAELDDPPSALLVSASGGKVVVLHPDAPFLTALDLSGPDGTAGSGFSKLDPGGADDVREMQRLLGKLGYPVGAVDGYLGPRTVQSLEAVKRRSGETLDIADPAEAVKTLRRVRSKF